MPPIKFCIIFFNLMININENTKMIKNQNHLGGICMILSVLFFSLMDVLIKVTYEYDVGQVMFSRALFGLIPIFFLIPRNRLKNFYKTKQSNLFRYSYWFIKTRTRLPGLCTYFFRKRCNFKTLPK